MSIGVLMVRINNREASLVYNPDTWRLSLRFLDSSTPEFEISMDEVKKIYVSSSYKEMHYEDKNKLARTVVGGALFGVTGAIIGAVSGEGSKEVVDGKYSFVHIETTEKEYILVCEENGIINSSWVFIQNFNDTVSSKNDESYRKKKKVAGILWGIVILVWIFLIIYKIADL